jgi:hypothetical protein
MRKYILAVILAGLVINSAVAGHAVTVHLPTAVFEDDGGETVHIRGLKAGGSGAEESSVPGMKTSIELWCNSKECAENQVTVYVHDGDVVEVFPPLHHRYSIKVWDASRIMAQYDFSCGGREAGRETWVIDRKKKTAELFGYPCEMANEAPKEIPAPWHYTLGFLP